MSNDTSSPVIDEIAAAIDDLRAAFQLDPRTSVFDVRVLDRGGDTMLVGAVSTPGIAAALRRRIATLSGGPDVIDRIVEIPERGVEPGPVGLVTAAIAPMLAGPVISESHISQVLLGHTVTVLREEERWLQCRAADGYIGWIHRGYLRRVEKDTALAWENEAGSELHLSLGSRVLDERGTPLAHLPWGARVAVRAESAILPDGRTGILAGESVPLRHLETRFPPRGDSVVSTARAWHGSPYLWGGTTPAGVDCSGLAQAVYRTHGIMIPRDSDQQAVAGTALPIEDLDEMRPGDLLFFAESEAGISHVAISVGGSRIIHSALGRGGVAENDLRGELDYEVELRSLLVAARRFIETAA